MTCGFLVFCRVSAPPSLLLLAPHLHQPIVTNQLSSTNCHHELSSANCLLQRVGCTPWRWLGLVGLRCCSAVICVRGDQNHCVLRGFVGVEDPQFGQWRNAKTVGFTRVVSVMRAARTCIIRFLVMSTNGAKCTPRLPNRGPQDRSKIG